MYRSRRSQELEARGEKWVPGLGRCSPVQSHYSSSEAKDGRPRTLRMLRRHMDDYAGQCEDRVYPTQVEEVRTENKDQGLRVEGNEQKETDVQKGSRL